MAIQFVVRRMANYAHKFEQYGFEHAQYSKVHRLSELPVVAELYFSRAVGPLCLNYSKRTCV